MADHEESDHPLDLASWLQAAGQRRVPAPDAAVESSDDILAYLESLTGRQLRSRSAVDLLIKAFADDEAKRLRKAKIRAARRHVLLLALAVASFLHYYYWDVSLQIAALPEMKVFVPITDRDRSTRHHV